MQRNITLQKQNQELHAEWMAKPQKKNKTKFATVLEFEAFHIYVENHIIFSGGYFWGARNHKRHWILC